MPATWPLAERPESLPLLEPLELTPQPPQSEPSLPDGTHGALALSFRHSGWQRHRDQINRAFRRTMQSVTRIAAFQTCGSHAYILRSIIDPERIRLAGSTCHDRFCVPCARDRAAVIVHNVLDRLGTDPVRFLTLTLKADGEPLERSVRRLTASFAALRRRAVWKNTVTGGVAFMEVHWSRTGQRWHPHLHCLVHGRFIPKRDLAAAWSEITRDSKVVDIRLVKDTKHLARYVTKYASKPLNASFVDDDDLLDEAILALHGKRVCMTFGTWQGVNLTTRPSDDEWENLGDFETILYKAGDGDAEAVALVEAVAPDQAESLIAQARAARPPPTRPAVELAQLTFYAAWDASETARELPRPTRR